MPGGADMARIQAGIDATMRAIVANPRIPTSASMIPDQQRSEDRPRPANGGTVEVKPPPGIEIIDRMVEAQTHKERIAALRQQLENDWIEGLLEKKTSHRARFEYSPSARYDAEVQSCHREKDDD